MTVSNGTCLFPLCVFYQTPRGRKREENISVNVNTAMQIKTFKPEVVQRCRAFLYSGVITVGA